MKIILCSSRDFVRERWRSILQKHAFSVYQASSLPILQSVVHKNEQYLLLVDQAFMDFQTTGTFCRNQDAFKVFVLSDTPARDDGIRLMMIGAVGYANTYISEGRLVEAVKTIEAGRVWFGQEIVSTLIKSVNAGLQPPDRKEGAAGPRRFDVLSERENEIAQLIAEGLSNSEIGERLFISERTVKSHLNTIFNKTGAGSRLKLALMILKNTDNV